MTTRIATALAEGAAEAVGRALVAEAKAELGNAAPALVVAFASTSQPLEQVLAPLAEAFPSAVLIGSTTSGEFTERGDKKGSTSLFAVAGDFKVFAGMGTGLRESPERAVEQAMQGLPREVNGYPHRTAILLLDPLAGNGEETTLIASSMLGADVRLAGGAAGDDLKMKETHVAFGRRAAPNAIVLAMIFSKSPLGVGASHGHVPISAPLRVTKAAGNIVYEIEGRPAIDVWREETRERAREQGIDVDRIERGKEGGWFLRYEAGLASGGDVYKIRAPLSRGQEDGSISFACGIAEGTVIRITESVAERQIESARLAARRAVGQLGNTKPAGAIVFDCICRNLILEEDFGRAVRGMSEELGGARLAGFETYGEIALDVGDMSGFHNTTSVVLAFPEN